MGTRIEDLSNELWLDVFNYLNLYEQFKAFSDLNKRLNAILFSYRNHVSYNNNDKNSQCLLTKLLPSLPRREEVTSLRLEKTKTIEVMYPIDLLYFPCLTRLALHRLDITEHIVKIVQESSAHLRFIHVSSLVSGNKKTLHHLLETILSLPKLRTCRLRTGIAMSAFPFTISSTSPMEDFKLLGKNEHCTIDRLTNLLSYLPCLQSLQIIASEFNSTAESTTHPVVKAPISNFILNLNLWNIRLLELHRFISTIAPHVKHLTLISRSPMENVDHLHPLIWPEFVESLHYLQKLTLIIHRHTSVNEQSWDKNCRLLTKRVHKRGITFHIDQTSRFT